MPFTYMLPFRLGEDSVPPALSNQNPANSTTLATATTTVAVDVTDASGIVSYVAVIAILADRPPTVIGYGDPSGSLTSPSTDFVLTASPITNGYRLSVAVSGTGWGEDPSLRVFAVDGYGNQMEFGDDTWAYVFAPTGWLNNPPTIENVDPAPDSEISADTPLEFDTLDDLGFRRVFIVAKYTALDTWEVVHDGSAFGPKYADESARTVVAGGFHFSIMREGGWPEAPTLEVLPIDNRGEEPA